LRPVSEQKTADGIVWRCLYCNRLKWIPADSAGQMEMQELFRDFGAAEGYSRLISAHQAAKDKLINLAKENH